MEIKCNKNNYYYSTPSRKATTHFQGVNASSRASRKSCVNITREMNCGYDMVVCENKGIKRPVVTKSATGLFGCIDKASSAVKEYFKNYKKNIKRTCDHKITFALIEKELFGRNSIDSITHDLDKLVMYILGAPHSLVTKIHRQISVHHTESGKKNNLRSMLCDNIASSPVFKPEKEKTVRAHFNSSIDLQSVDGFKELLEKYDYGENINFDSIMVKKHKAKGKILAPFSKLAKVSVSRLI